MIFQTWFFKNLVKINRGKGYLEVPNTWTWAHNLFLVVETFPPSEMNYLIWELRIEPLSPFDKYLYWHLIYKWPVLIVTPLLSILPGNYRCKSRNSLFSNELSQSDLSLHTLSFFFSQINGKFCSLLGRTDCISTYKTWETTWKQQTQKQSKRKNAKSEKGALLQLLWSALLALKDKNKRIFENTIMTFL